MRQHASFTVEQTHGRVFRQGNELASHSSELGWRSLYAAVFREAPLAADEPAIGHASLIYHLARPTRVSRRIDGLRAEAALVGPTCITLTPGDALVHWEHSGSPEILQLYLHGSIYTAVAAEMLGRDERAPALVPRFAIVDPLLEQLALAVLAALRDGTAHDALYIEHIAQLLAAHLVRAHSTERRLPARPSADGLSRARTRRLIEYIDHHLDGDLSIQAIAAEVGLSPLYLARSFRLAMGQAPHRYVVGRRIDRAQRLLRETQASIAEIAAATGFSSHSHLSQWFRRIVGVSPAEYRRGS
jgi:AraC family transcriptional regulator